MSNENSLCQICSTDTFKYVCPRCNVAYCSVKCYKAISHSDCSEAFYKECVQEFVQSQEKDPESRKKMLDILQRVRENDENALGYSSDDSDDVESISERLDGINLDDADSVWEKLTEEEKKDFINLIKEGDVTKLLPVWEPWWCKRHSMPKVRFVDVEENKPDFEEECPPISKHIPLLSDLTKTKPSKNVFFNLVNVLGGYVIMARYCNGEHSTMIEEAVSILLSISKNLGENENYVSLDFALESVTHESINCEFVTTTDAIRNCMKEDVINILNGPNEEKFIYYIEAALSDIYSILQKYKKPKPNVANKGNFSVIFPEINKDNKYTKEVISKCLQKVKFYQSWCLEYFTPNLYL